MNTTILEAEGLQKKFKDFKALDGVSFKIQTGRILAYLGHNGAGKTTTIRCLLGLIRPTAGRIFYMQREVNSDSGEYERLRSNFGVCLEGGGFYPDLSAMDNLKFYAGLYGLSGDDFEQRAGALLEKLGLHDFRHQPVKTFSKGMSQKLALIKALQHKPKVLFLDEPMSGLDPATRVMMREFLLDLKATDNVAILITSHDLGEVEQMCDDVVILEKGKIKLAGTLAELKKAHSGLGFEIHTDRQALVEADVSFFREIPGVSSVLCRGGVCHLESCGDISLEQILPPLTARGIKITEFKKAEASLERVYMDSLRQNEKPLSPSDKI